jgi:hypothetical protein
VTRDLLRTVSFALAIAAAHPITAFSETDDRSQNVVGAAPAPLISLRDQEMVAEQGQDFVLGDTMGVAYFTSEPGGLRLVATVGSLGGTPVRFVATLAPDQTASVSVPGRMGEASTEVSFSRRGERLVVRSLPRAGD